MQCKAVTAILFKAVGPPPKPNQTVIVVPETPLQKYLSTEEPPIEVTPIRPIIPPYLQFIFLWSRMENISSQSSSVCDIRYRDDLLITRRRTRIVESPTGRHSTFVINVIQGIQRAPRQANSQEMIWTWVKAKGSNGGGKFCRICRQT